MFIDLQTGLLSEAIQRPSPNYNDRPDNTEINLLIIHGISLPAGEFGGTAIDDLFLNRIDPIDFPDLKDLKVSSHLLIRRTGELIQYVPFNKRAWHAGVSCFEGRENCNDFSIGIELEGADDIPYEEAQYQQLGLVTQALQQAYPAITPEGIVGHSDVAPGRKTDPGSAFDWSYYRELLYTARR